MICSSQARILQLPQGNGGIHGPSSSLEAIWIQSFGHRNVAASKRASENHAWTIEPYVGLQNFGDRLASFLPAEAHKILHSDTQFLVEFGLELEPSKFLQIGHEVDSRALDWQISPNQHCFDLTLRTSSHGLQNGSLATPSPILIPNAQTQEAHTVNRRIRMECNRFSRLHL